VNWNARAPASCSAAIVDRVERYVLEEVMSGADGGGWVTLGFRSGLKPNDVLHIVASGSRAIYLERFDQAYSLDAAAIAVRAGVSCVEVDLTDDAQRALAFAARSLAFDGADKLPAYEDALRIFAGMARAGYPVRIE